MQDTTPKRIVLRLNVRHERETTDIIKSFFAKVNLEPGDDYYAHLLAPGVSSKMHIILDLHCRTFPSVDLGTVAYEVFLVRKDADLYVFLLPQISR